MVLAAQSNTGNQGYYKILQGTKLRGKTWFWPLGKFDAAYYICKVRPVSLKRAVTRESRVCRHRNPGMVAEGSLLRKKGKAVSAGCSRVQCLFKSSSSSLCLGKEQPLHATAQWGMLPGVDTIIGKSLLTWSQEVPWNSAMAWNPLSSLWHMTTSVMKQFPKSTSVWWQKGVEQRDSCLQTKQAA